MLSNFVVKFYFLLSALISLKTISITNLYSFSLSLGPFQTPLITQKKTHYNLKFIEVPSFYTTTKRHYLTFHQKKNEAKRNHKPTNVLNSPPLHAKFPLKLTV